MYQPLHSNESIVEKKLPCHAAAAAVCNSGLPLMMWHHHKTITKPHPISKPRLHLSTTLLRLAALDIG
jgi:hypothetical protein